MRHLESVRVPTVIRRSKYMGFRTGAYATIWSVEDKGRFSSVRISTSKKNRDTGAYEQDFSGYVRFIGTAHQNSGSLKEKDRIKLGDTDVTTSYDAKRKITYTNYALFSFEDANGSGSNGTQGKSATSPAEIPDTEDDPF